jgi:SAM-dependent methyltransferase
MTREQSIIEFGTWLQTPPGRYLLAWEQDRLDHAVADVFGYHALQLGLPELEGLRNNRMPHRWVACDSLMPTTVFPSVTLAPASASDSLLSTVLPPERVGLFCEFDALPFPNNSLDLVVLPHTLELARDPHQTLREVERVLVPEGRVAIAGFNPASLWGVRQRGGRLRERLTWGGGLNNLYLPSAGEFMGYWRLRDWLRLLGFEVEVGQFGCWRPPLKTQSWLDRFEWMDRLGDRWWPVFGGVYFLAAVKRVRGMRLVGRVRHVSRKAAAAPAVVANCQRRERAKPESL